MRFKEHQYYPNMDPSILESIAHKAVTLFGKTSAHAITITELPEVDKIDHSDEKYAKLINDLKAFLEELKPVTFTDGTDAFAFTLRRIREADQFAMMHILSVMSKLRSVEPIGSTLDRWIEITKQRKAVDAE